MFVPAKEAAVPSAAIVMAEKLCVVSADTLEEYALFKAGRFVEASRRLQAAFDALTTKGADTKTLACLMIVIGLSEQRAQRPRLALDWFQRALELKELPEALISAINCNLSQTYRDLRQLDRAEEVARKTVALSERAFGPGHPETLFPQTTLALVYADRGELARAEPVLRRILYQSEQLWGPSSNPVAQAAYDLAMLYFSQLRFELARELLKKTIAALRANPVRDKGEIPLVTASLAVSCAAGGHTREANTWLEQALASAKHEVSPQDPAVALIFERGAVARFYLKDHDSGRQLFDQAIAWSEAHHGSSSPPVLGALERYAETLRSIGDKAGARKIEARRSALASSH